MEFIKNITYQFSDEIYVKTNEPYKDTEASALLGL